MHDWKRRNPLYLTADLSFVDEWEYAVTKDLTPPPGEGWVLASKFGVGKVKGAGNSPARSS